MPETKPDSRVDPRLLSPLPESAEQPSPEPTDGVGLCLSGGGYRAMLFHVGSLWRLNELGWLPKLTRISSVSGGSITAGVLGLAWSKLAFQGGLAVNFQELIVDPLRRMAATSIDVSSVLTGILLPTESISDRVAKRYAKTLFGDATLQSLPDDPVFVFCATNVQTGSLMRFSKKRLADWQVGEVTNPMISLASAVTASSAFPPVLSPADIKLSEGMMQSVQGATLNHPPYNTELVLTDGGVYDNMGIEPIWKRCHTVLVSDAGQKMLPTPSPADDWPRHMLRILDLLDNQVRALRKRQVVGSFQAGTRAGAYWGIRTDIGDYDLADALPCPFTKTEQLAAVPTRLNATDGTVQEMLINWGYAVTDAAMRKHADPENKAPLKFPYERGLD